VGSRDVLNTVVKRKIPSPHRELNSRTPKISELLVHFSPLLNISSTPVSIPGPKVVYRKVLGDFPGKNIWICY